MIARLWHGVTPAGVSEAYASPEAIRRFAGADLERAVYYPRDREFLETLEPAVTHYEVVEPAGPPFVPGNGTGTRRTADLSDAYRRILRVPA